MVRSREQMRAIFANMGTKKTAKRAAIGVGVAATAAYLAHKTRSPGVQKAAAALAATSALGAAGIVGSGAQRVKDAQKDFTTKTKIQAEATKHYAGRSLTAVKDAVANMKVEALAASAVDWNARLLETALAMEIGRRTARLENFTAGKIGELQTLATIHAGNHARDIHTKLFKPPTQATADAIQSGAKLYQQVKDQYARPRPLRRGGGSDSVRFDAAVRSGVRQMMSTSQLPMPSTDEIRKQLASKGFDPTSENIETYRKALMGRLYPSLSFGV